MLKCLEKFCKINCTSHGKLNKIRVFYFIHRDEHWSWSKFGVHYYRLEFYTYIKMYVCMYIALEFTNPAVKNVFEKRHFIKTDDKSKRKYSLMKVQVGKYVSTYFCLAICLITGMYLVSSFICWSARLVLRLELFGTLNNA